MTTKVNLFRPPPRPVPGQVRIIIDVDPVKGSSTLRTEGPITVPFVLDCLIAQITGVWRQWWQSQAGALTTPDGRPITPTAPKPPPDPGTSEGEGGKVQ